MRLQTRTQEIGFKDSRGLEVEAKNIGIRNLSLDPLTRESWQDAEKFSFIVTPAKLVPAKAGSGSPECLEKAGFPASGTGQTLLPQE